MLGEFRAQVVVWKSFLAVDKLINAKSGREILTVLTLTVAGQKRQFYSHVTFCEYTPQLVSPRSTSH